MRTTSRILGIIGSALAILLGSLAVYNAVTYVQYDYYYDYYDGEDEYNSIVMPSVDDTLPGGSAFWDDIDATGFLFGGASVLGGLLGVAASICVNKRHAFSGTLFIIAAVISVSTTIPTILFIIASVYALNKPKPPAAPVMIVPVPAGAYTGYYTAAWPPPGASGNTTAYTYYGAFPPSPAAYAPGAVIPPPLPPNQTVPDQSDSFGQPAPHPYYGVYPPPSSGQPDPAAYPPGIYPVWPYAYSWAAPPPHGPASPPSDANTKKETNEEVE